MTDETKVLDSVPTGLLIGGEWRPATGGRTFVVEGVALAVVPGGTRREPFRCALARDPASGGWTPVGRAPD